MQNARLAGHLWPILLILAALIIPSSPHAKQLPAEMAAPKVFKAKKDEAKRIRRGKVSEMPDAPPIPEARPAEPSPAPEPPVAAPVLPPKPGLPSREELACRTRLTQLGAVFKEATPVINEQGCNMPHPIEMSRMTDKIDIAPGVVLNCATAETAVRFIREVASPAAKAEFGLEVKSIAQASGFVCRPRNGTTRLSEHAFGNALDIASFTLTNGTVIQVEPAPPSKNEKFLRAVRDAACGPFKTVLGPGSDADHALHFHFDLAQRRNGGTYCK
ncbi:MAG: extensin family protein [Rhizobiaceae bacterium]